MAKHDIYLNHAGTSWPKPQIVIDAVNEAMTRSPGEWGGSFEAAHQAIADFFGIPDPDQLLLTPGCTSSLAVAIGDIDLGGRSRVLASVWEHHAMHRPLLKLIPAGKTLHYIPPGNGSALDLNELENELSQGDVGLVAITAAANVTGDLLPYTDAIKLAHQHGAQVLLDAAQVVGWLDLDFGDLRADVVAFGGHKGLQGPWGIGGLYMAPGARMNCSRGTSKSSSAEQALRPGYCDVGSVDQVALAGLHAATGWLQKTDRAACLRQAREQIGRIEVALMRAGARCFSINDASRRMPTLAFSTNGYTSAALTAALRALGITVGSGLQCAPLAHQALGTQDEGLVRISVGIGQDTDEIEAAVATICAQIKT